MRNVFAGFSTRVATVPKSCGKACVYVGGIVWAGCGQFLGFVTAPGSFQQSLRTSAYLYNELYTKCTRLYTPLFSLFTPVSRRLYTVSTAPTNITTTYINTIRRTL